MEENIEGIIGVSDKIKETSAKAIQVIAKDGSQSHYADGRQ